MSGKLDIISLIEDKSSIIGDYHDKVIQKIKHTFTSEEEQLFVASFQCYLKYNPNIDFVIELNKIWKWLGYSRIDPCKIVLIKNFKENVDYKIESFVPQVDGAGPKLSEEGKNLGGAGLNKEYITLTIICFKKLCLKSRTEKADKIHDYYVKLEETIHEVMKEETNELRAELKRKNKEIENIANKNEQELLLKHNKKRCFYLISVTDKIVKFGITNDIVKRLSDHKRDISEDIVLMYVLETVYNAVIEKKIKELCSNENDILFGKRVSIEYNGKNQTELLNLDKLFTIEQLWKKILQIEKSINKDELFIQMEQQIEALSIKKDVEEDYNDYDYIFIESTDVVNQYIVDVTNDPNRSSNVYKTKNSKYAKALLYLLLDAFKVTENIFELPYNAIKDTLEYSIMTYDHYKINKNDINRFVHIQRYVTRHPEDKMIINNSKEILSPDIYQKYIDENIEFGDNYKVPIIKLFEGINIWYIEKFPKSKLDLHSVLEKDLKDDIVKNFTKLTGKEKVILNTFDKNTGKKFSSYPGFIGFRIKEETGFLYPEEIYKEFIENHLEHTGDKKDRVFRSQLTDMFVIFVTENYKLHKDTKGQQRYKLGFLNEFNIMMKKILNVDFDSELRSSANKLNLHGGFRECKLKIIED